MGHYLNATALAALGLSLAGSSADAGFAARTLDAMDPVRTAEAICGARRAGPPSVLGLLAGTALAAPASIAAAIPLYPDLAGSRFPVTTKNEDARRYFSQGLMLSYGFNHAGAVRSFREAQSRDPGCAMCWWGEALALGPNINAPMDDRDRGAALAAMDRAMALRDRASPMEQALIEAVALRYSRDPAADRAALDAAYADTMLAVTRRFPLDDDVAMLAAEAAMDTSPWNYWEPDNKTPLGRSGEAIRLVETVLARNPEHPQAAHLYIHLLEASDPQRAEAAADRLAKPLTPSAGHLVHMPGHIYHRRGRYSDAIKLNIAAARADEAYIRATGDQGLVRYGYYPHNIHFIVASAQMAGDMNTAIGEARRLGTVLDTETSARIGWIQAIDAAPYLAMAQFAAPDAILAMPAPDARLPYARAMRHYARAIAHATNRDRKAFDREIAAMQALAPTDATAALIEQGMPADEIIKLAETAARGRFAMTSGRYAEAAELFQAAAEIEKSLPYQEPPFWYYPVHQSLGAALFLSGRHAEASRAFQTALTQAPRNGWALYGLSRSEAALGRSAEAAAARAAFRREWMGDPAWLRMDRL